jgi:hypothetical protein
MKRSLLSLFLFAMSCASTGSSTKPQSATLMADPAQAQEGSTVLVCEQEMPTGSFIAETKCRRMQDKDADRRNAQQFMEEAPTHSVPPRGH